MTIIGPVEKNSPTLNEIAAEGAAKAIRAAIEANIRHEVARRSFERKAS